MNHLGIVRSIATAFVLFVAAAFLPASTARAQHGGGGHMGGMGMGGMGGMGGF